MNSRTSLTPTVPRSVLVVDDDAQVRRALARLLAAEGWEIVTAASGAAALDLVGGVPLGAIVSDISMPGLDGLALLRAVRAHDLDVPVILVTAEPSLTRAAEAVELGAFRFIAKPTDPSALGSAVRAAVAFGAAARVRREALRQLDASRAQSGDLAALGVCFERALEGLWMAYQPIVRWSDRSIHAYEALVRSTEPALPHPGALLDAADQLERMRDLSRRIRERVVQPFDRAPAGTRLFVNLHTGDLEDEMLCSANSPLAAIASRVTLEITERASLHAIDSVRERVQALRALGYQIALDDLGAGYAGLSSLALLEPEVVKLDMSLVRDIDTSPVKQKLVAAMVGLSATLGHEVVAEGVETRAELDALLGLGCDLYQGYLFARPARTFPVVAWP